MDGARLSKGPGNAEKEVELADGSAGSMEQEVGEVEDRQARSALVCFAGKYQHSAFAAGQAVSLGRKEECSSCDTLSLCAGHVSCV